MSLTLGQKLRQVRKARGLTQEQLAQSLYVSRQTISSWETDRTQPDYEALQTLANLLQMDFGEIPQSASEQADAQAATEVAAEKPKRLLYRAIIAAVLLAALVWAFMALPRWIARVQYPGLEWFQEEVPVTEGQAYLKLIPGETPLKAFAYPTGTPPRWSTRIYLQETNGVGVTVKRITTYLFEKDWLGNSRAVSSYVYSDFDIAHQMGESYIGPEQIRMILCDMTADGQTVGMGVQIETIDQFENERIFRLFLPFEQP